MNDELNSSQDTSMSEQNSDTNQENIDNIEKQVVEPVIESEIVEEKSFNSPIEPQKNKGKKLVIFIMILIILLLISLEFFYFKDILSKKNNTNKNDNDNIVTKIDEGNVNTETDVNNTSTASDESNKVNAKYLYFYSKDEQLVLMHNDMSDSYGEYLGKYKCVSEYCNMLVTAYTTKIFDLENRTILIGDKSMLLYSYAEEKTLLNLVDVYGDILFVESDGKYAIADFSGKIISKYYDNISGVVERNKANTTPKPPLQNYSKNKMLAEYRLNGKSGLLLLDTGNELTEPIYDEIVIYNDTMIAKKGELEYLIEETGTIISKGFNKILYSKGNAIVIQESEEIDIVDKDGKSYISSKIKTNGQEYRRYNVYECIGCIYIYINNVEKGFNISIPNSDRNYPSVTYFFDTTTNKLTVQE